MKRILACFCASAFLGGSAWAQDAEPTDTPASPPAEVAEAAPPAEESKPAETKAEPTPSFDDLVKKGLAAYKDRSYENALVNFEKAYEVDSRPSLLFNIARCQERLGKNDDAIATYQKYLEADGSTADGRARALKNMQALQRENTERERAQQGPGTTTGPSTVVTTAPPSRTMEWTFIGAGAGAAVVGGIFGVLALRSQSEFDDSINVDDKRSNQDSGETNALVADLLIGVGLISAGIGAVLLVTADDGTEVASLSPSVGPSGVSVVGRF